MKHKYLIDNNIPHGIYKPKKDDHRIEKWKETRKLYGFDERETWSLKDQFLSWLYEHIKMYIDVCDCDLTYHKFDYKGEELTHLDILNRILGDVEMYYNVGEYFDNYPDWWSKQPEYLREIGELWGLVLPAMWW